ncbi:hypothetical protein [Motilibacter deserti]|uniref:ESAT-6 protein secretion system EspG family protein n=1 Tax=Motilibacter deserti TaxID=2714956 RepID=A0ABX0GV53_9ACTN|nr:hypothetical protein [Motilibacter deserti]NHC14803.1 hypothetical protein [Motilibacter deserti]
MAPVPVLDLTDEEVAVLATTEGPVVLPYLGTLEPDERLTATRTAYRSLVARGLLEAPTPQQVLDAEREARTTGEDVAAYPVRMPEELARVLTLRAGASAVVCCALTTALGQEYRYAHVVEDVVLLEEVTPTGLHRLALLDAAALTEHVAGWVLHPEATPGAGEEVVQLVSADDDPTPPDELLAALGASMLRADLVVRAAGDGGAADLLGVFSGPAGTWSSRVTAGSRAPVVIRPVAPEDVRAAVAELVGSTAR